MSSRRSQSPVEKIFRDLMEAECDFNMELHEDAFLFEDRLRELPPRKHFDVPVVPLKSQTKLLIGYQTRKNMIKKQRREKAKQLREQKLKEFIQIEACSQISKILHTIKEDSKIIQECVAYKFSYEAKLSQCMDSSIADELEEINKDFSILAERLKSHWSWLERTEARLETAMKQKKLVW